MPVAAAIPQGSEAGRNYISQAAPCRCAPFSRERPAEVNKVLRGGGGTGTGPGGGQRGHC